ncbi:hypothetical protein Rhow_005841 [Rhodococcus wratislaviensis]|uniref:Uncharacterized protein n=1 Tax=Rhodococcus wratislaviensis TaxID=44752 RepID=A0A402BZS6_RHOWR|nr:hypothetical protein Rhow_005841 [Rhodococcus wratislaviensis]
MTTVSLILVSAPGSVKELLRLSGYRRDSRFLLVLRWWEPLLPK